MMASGDFLDTYFQYNQETIGVLFALVLIGLAFLLYHEIRRKPSIFSEDAEGLGELEGLLKRLASQPGQGPIPASTASSSLIQDDEDDLSIPTVDDALPDADMEIPIQNDTVEIGADGSVTGVVQGTVGPARAAAAPSAEASDLQKTIDQQTQIINRLRSSLDAANDSKDPGQGTKLRALEKRTKELEARLAEYEIIEDDIADLSLFKEENERLKQELDSMRKTQARATVAEARGETPLAPEAPAPASGDEAAILGALDEVSPPPAAEPALTPEPSVQAAAPAAAPAVEPEPSKIDESDVDDMLTEFSQSIGETADTVEEPPPPASGLEDSSDIAAAMAETEKVQEQDAQQQDKVAQEDLGAVPQETAESVDQSESAIPETPVVEPPAAETPAEVSNSAAETQAVTEPVEAPAATEDEASPVNEVEKDSGSESSDASDLFGSPDTDKMLNEMAGLGEEPGSEDPLAEDINTEKMVAEMSELEGIGDSVEGGEQTNELVNEFQDFVKEKDKDKEKK